MPPRQPGPTVCTIFEGHYHFGGAALVNSLLAHGYTGKVWIGTRGALPPWVGSLQESGPNRYVVAGVELCFVQLDVQRTMSAEKPRLMLQILRELEPESNGVVYFDADIVLNVPWTIISDWVGRGVALCEDNCFGYMAGNHLLRAQWTDFANSTFPANPVRRELNRSYNAGFVGVARQHASFLDTWHEATSRLPVPDAGVSLKMGTRWSGFSSMEQDTLNVTAMVSAEPLVTLGPEGMGFAPGLNAMLHAVDTPKPWRKWYVWHLLYKGVGVGPADRAYWEHASGPLATWPTALAWLHRLDMFCAIALSRFYHSA